MYSVKEEVRTKVLFLDFFKTLKMSVDFYVRGTCRGEKQKQKIQGGSVTLCGV